MGELFRGQQHALFTDRRKSLRNIAEKLGVDKDTVRNRIAKLSAIGFLTGWVALANPNLFGVSQTVILFDVPATSSKEDLICKMKQIPSVVLIGNFHGSSMLVILYHESQQSLTNALQLISGISGTENLFRYENAFPECKIALSKTDWSIIKSLQNDPLRSHTLIARDLGVSGRTVKRRLDRLIEGKALIAIPKLDLSAIDGTVANLVVNYTNPEQRKEVEQQILSYLDDYIFRADLSQRTHGLFMLILRNVPQANAISKWVRQQAGVSRHRLDLFQERIEQWESYHELLNSKQAPTPPIST